MSQQAVCIIGIHVKLRDESLWSRAGQFGKLNGGGLVQALGDQRTLAGLAALTRHCSAQVRRSAIECFVALQQSLGNKILTQLEPLLGTTQLKLVHIYSASNYT